MLYIAFRLCQGVKLNVAGGKIELLVMHEFEGLALRARCCDLVLTRPSALSNMPLDDETFGSLHCHLVAFANHTSFERNPL